ncbi:MAG: thymidine phosphorylase [Myxococcales bacterium]|nr:thymidine phosphorylase [Myxococcales bacterium]
MSSLSFLPQTLIRQKRNGETLSPDELRFFVEGVTSQTIPDYQVSAMLMAIYFRGMADEELAVWADAMLHSGEVLDLGSIDRPKVDKHSTGGVGDKISLPLAPAVAACGVAVPMVSGRGLGHTGGTLDKLESIPGFSVNLDIGRFTELVDTLGLCLIGQTAEIAPADKRFYSLRDVTATVESVPLIASSIMSKKLAEGIDALVLDCKVGHGAFMKTMDEAHELATAIQVIGRAAGKPVTAVITDMNAPIGTTIGNALEVSESIAILRGEGPADSRELTVVLGAEMLLAAGVESEQGAAKARIETVLDNGQAAQCFSKLVEAQGGDPRVVDLPDTVLPQAAHKTDVLARDAGSIGAIAARDMGVAGLWLGAGRRAAKDSIDHSVGIELRAKVGDSIQVGDVLATVHHNDQGLAEAIKLIEGAYTISNSAVEVATSRILEVLR